MKINFITIFILGSTGGADFGAGGVTPLFGLYGDMPLDKIKINATGQGMVFLVMLS